jgi:molecular chaperone GrpE
LVDAALAAEEAPAGIDPAIVAALPDEPGGEAVDAYALWAAVTSLTQEVKLQGRAFQELNHTLQAQTDRLLEELRSSYAARESSVRREAELRSRKESLTALIDLRDRLGRGRESVRAHEQAPRKDAGWLGRLWSPPDTSGADALGALVRGYELSLERLDQTLEELNAREIRCDGELFDPRRMNAIDSAESSAVPEGTVLEVYRSGYEWNGEVFRTAQVKVARAPRGADNP